MLKDERFESVRGECVNHKDCVFVITDKVKTRRDDKNIVLERNVCLL